MKTFLIKEEVKVKRTKSFFMIMLILIVSLSLGGCTLFGNKDEVEKEENAQIAARGVMLAITDENAGPEDIEDYMASSFNVKVNVKIGNLLPTVEIDGNYSFKTGVPEITELFEKIRKEIFRGSSISGFTYTDMLGSQNKVTVETKGDSSSDTIKAYCKYNVEIADVPISNGKITFEMKSVENNNIVITGIEIEINVLNTKEQ